MREELHECGFGDVQASSVPPFPLDAPDFPATLASVMNVFLSYRRGDAAGHAGRLAEALERTFGDAAVFQDIEAIAPGEDFADAIDRALSASGVLLVMIGRGWLGAADAEGRPRLQLPEDFVRLEIEKGFAHGIAVIPLLVGGALMPRADELPPSIAALARRQSIELSDSRWDYDVSRVVEAVRALEGRDERRIVSRRRRVAAVGAAAVAASAAGALGWRILSSRTPDVSGRWVLPSGSTWRVVQQGDSVSIEETHYESREVWKRGSGTIAGGILRYRLDFVFQPNAVETGELRLEADGQALRGTALVPPSERAVPVNLDRSR